MWSHGTRIYGWFVDGRFLTLLFVSFDFTCYLAECYVTMRQNLTAEYRIAARFYQMSAIDISPNFIIKDVRPFAFDRSDITMC